MTETVTFTTEQYETLCDLIMAEQEAIAGSEFFTDDEKADNKEWSLKVNSLRDAVTK